jgi:RNA polymerase sigma-70 factor (ECF subfamily)
MNQPAPEPNDQRTRQFLLLLGRHERRLRAFILSLVPNWADADDIGQEVKIRLWEQFDSYDPAKDFGAWARTIAHYQVLSYREKQGRESRRMSDKFVEALADEASRLSEELDAGQQALKDCFDKLPAAKREMLVHYYSGERTTREIAAELGRTFDATRQAILRTRIALRDCVEETLEKAAAGGRAQPEEHSP